MTILSSPHHSSLLLGSLKNFCSGKHKFRDGLSVTAVEISLHEPFSIFVGSQKGRQTFDVFPRPQYGMTKGIVGMYCPHVPKLVYVTGSGYPIRLLPPSYPVYPPYGVLT